MRDALYRIIKDRFNSLPESIRKYHLPYPAVGLSDRFYWLVACGRLVCPEYRFKWPQLDWWKDSDFTKYLKLFGEDQGMNSDRHWNLHQFLKLVDNVDGDTVECGCYKGASSYLVCQKNSMCSLSKMHYVFDSFEGLSRPDSCDGEHWQVNDLKASEDSFHANMKDYEGHYRVLKGWIPDRFAEVKDKRFSFVHIDVDLYQPTRDSIEFFYPRMVKGGLIICDDYGSSLCPGATSAVDAFMKDKKESIIMLASGAAVIIKQ